MKNWNLNIRLTPLERVAWRKAAELEGMTLSEWVRNNSYFRIRQQIDDGHYPNLFEQFKGLSPGPR